MEKTKRGNFLQSKQIDMTEGNILSSVLRFALPLLIGNLFQQLYNMVDTWVIGQTGLDDAYAAVGSVGPIINILIGFFSGLATGSGVVISQYFGAKNKEKIRVATHNAIIITIVLSILFTLIGVLCTPFILRLMLEGSGTSSDVLPYAKTYLTIYFSGISALLIYNMGAGILRAIGDSTRPFYFLVVSAVINTGLDLLFVRRYNMGVEGVAYATVIAEIISAVLVIAVLFTTKTDVKVKIKYIVPDKDVLKKILRVGMPSALQLAITAFSNVFVQKYISGVNGVQTYCLGGWTTYSKVDAFIFLPVQSIALAVTTFVGQNCGVGDIKRAKRGTYISFLTSIIISAVIIVIVELFATPLSVLFNPTPNVVENATMLLRYITPFYLLCSVNQVFSAAMRGAGQSAAPMLIMLSTFVGFRQVYLFFMSKYISNELISIGFGYPAGWLACATATTIFYFCFFKIDKKKLI